MRFTLLAIALTLSFTAQAQRVPVDPVAERAARGHFPKIPANLPQPKPDAFWVAYTRAFGTPEQVQALRRYMATPQTPGVQVVRNHDIVTVYKNGRFVEACIGPAC